jgi:phospholipid/cholesterol/gamma-HCH transport system substrate-binding protein
VAEKLGGNDPGYYARFGLILQQDGPVCKKGYEGTDRRSALDTADRPMKTNVGCADGSKNFRGAEKAPAGRTGAAYRSPVATYDASTGKVTWSDQDTSPNVAYTGGAAQLFGADSWKWMLLQPALDHNQE